MEHVMKDTYRENPKPFGFGFDEQTLEICRRRQIRKLKANYTTADNLHTALASQGVQAQVGKLVSVDTCEKLMKGQLPGPVLWLSLMGSDLWPTFQWIYEPAISGGNEASLIAQREQKRQEMLRHDRELEELRRARKNRRPDLRSIDGQGAP